MGVSSPKRVQTSQKQVPDMMESKMQIQTHAMDHETLPEPEEEQDTQQETPESDELSVICSDVSAHDSDFDFLQISTDDAHAGFSLFSPSPCKGPRFPGTLELELGPLASPPLSAASSVACSPSRFFKSPLISAASKISESCTEKTPRMRSIVPIRLTTPKRMIDSEEKALIPVQNELESKQQVQQVFTRPPRNVSTTATPQRTPTRQQLLSRRLQDVFDQTDDEEREGFRTALKSPVVKKTYQGDMSSLLLNTDDNQCAPSGFLHSPSENDSFFSFANSLSSLIPAEEFENSFLSVKLSPLVALSTYELPRLLPPFPDQQADHLDTSSTNAYQRSPTILKTPNNTRRGVSPTGLLPGSGISAPGSVSALVSPSFFGELFPNIQASTSATPGKDERSKLAGHSVMRMKLHTSFGALDSHPAREMQAINNSLKRKRYIRRRKTEVQTKAPSSNVQRKLLQTPVKRASSQTRSPLHPWNGQKSPANLFKAPTPRKLAPSPQQPSNFAMTSSCAAPPSPLLVRRLIPAAEPKPTPCTPVINKRKRKASQGVSIPSGMENLSGMKTRKSIAPAVTPAKQIKREVIATPPGKYTFLSPQNNRGAVGMATLDSSMLKTPTSIGASTSLKMSLQSTSKAPLGPGMMLMPTQVPKKAPCNCKKSKCLKLYCECFASGGYCDESCNCVGCANTIATENVRQQAIAARLEKNPNAFKSKIGATPAMVIVTPGDARRLSASVSGGSRSSAASFVSPPSQLNFRLQQQGLATTKMHKNGCHCKKSACQKKYCECFQAGVPCGENCRCSDCKNQAQCVSHANGLTTPGSAVGGTPSRIANELDETFVSPVLRTVRQHLRVDRDIWTKKFTNPFETSPRHKELFGSQVFASTQVTGMRRPSSGVRVRAAPFTSPPTRQIPSRVGVKRHRDMSPLRGEREEDRAMENGDWLKQQQYVKGKGSVGKAALSAVTSSSTKAERVFVLPLFGFQLPPLESNVSAIIFRFLSNADVHNASLVSHLWYQVALGDTVWDYANFLPTESNVAASRSSHKNQKLMTPEKRRTNKQLKLIKREPTRSVLSGLR